jgi:dipeptide/tripeptide permease
MVAMVCNIALAFVSDRLKIRSPFLLLGAVFGLLGWLLELLAIPHISPKTGLGAPGMRYAGMFCIAIGAFVQIPILVVWLGNNLRGRKARVVGLAVIIGGGQSGNFVAANVFITGQENRGFIAGFATGAGVTCLGIFAALALAVGLWYENKGLDRKRREEENIGELSDARLVPFRNTL